MLPAQLTSSRYFSLPEETVHQLVDEFISEAGVDIFLHQLFDQEFEMR